MAPPNEELTIAIPGSCSLKDIKAVIRWHEGFLWKFKSSAIDGKLNLALLVASDFVPAEFEFSAESTMVPDGKTKEWSGKLRYNDAEQAVQVFRVTAA